MNEIKICLNNKAGFHARPATLFAKTAMQYKATIKVEYDGREVDAKSVINLLTLGSPSGSEIVIKADGTDESEAIEDLKSLVINKFNEE